MVAETNPRVDIKYSALITPITTFITLGGYKSVDELERNR